MRIISFSKKWDKLNQPEFTTFRFPRKDSDKGRDWHLGEIVQIYYHNRCPDREYLGTAEIMRKFTMLVCDIDDELAVADGFPGGCAEMVEWLESSHKQRLEMITQINKLTLRWVSRVNPVAPILDESGFASGEERI
jgi:hypothetical protein